MDKNTFNRDVRPYLTEIPIARAILEQQRRMRSGKSEFVFPNPQGQAYCQDAQQQLAEGLAKSGAARWAGGRQQLVNSASDCKVATNSPQGMGTTNQASRRFKCTRRDRQTGASTHASTVVCVQLDNQAV